MKRATRVVFGCCLSLFAALALAAPAQAAIVYALTDENDLLTFNSATPEDADGTSIFGLFANEDLLGIDIRPATNQLYGLGSFGTVYQINPATGVATPASFLNVGLVGSRFGLDFDPVADRLRVTSDSDRNLEVNVTTGVTTVHTNLHYTGNTPNPSVAGSAYTNNYNTGAGTTLYDIDVRGTGDRLVIQNTPNSGLLNLLPGGGALGVNGSALVGFDILSIGVSNFGYAAMQPVTGGISQFYAIDLNTGAATLIGDIGGGDLIDGITLLVPEPATLAMAATALVAGVFIRRRRS